MQVAYSCQLDPPRGFALVAHHAIEALREKGYLDQLLTPSTLGLGSRATEKFDFYFDTIAAQKLYKCNVFVGWANASLEQIRKAKSFGAATFIDRGSAHILLQKELLEKEGLYIDLTVVDRQLQEYEEVDHIIVDSNFIKESFQTFGFGDKVHVLNLGVDAEKFKPGVKKTDKFVAIFVGGNWIRKGLAYLLHAWDSLDLKGAELRIIGGAAMQYPNPTVKFTGHVEDIVREYQDANCFICPSIEDGWLMAACEACACELPVIISTNTGCKDILQDGYDSLIIPPRDIKAIEHSILYFYGDRDRAKEMGMKARKTVESHTWANYQDNFVKILEAYG